MSDCESDFKCAWCKDNSLAAEPSNKYGACKEAELEDRISVLSTENGELRAILLEVQEAVNNADARVAIECDSVSSSQGGDGG